MTLRAGWVVLQQRYDLIGSGITGGITTILSILFARVEIGGVETFVVRLRDRVAC